MKKIIKDIPLYRKEGTDCFLSCLANVLEYSGYHIGFGWGFFYWRGDECPLTKGKKGYRISPCKQSLTEDLSKAYSITCKHRNTSDPEEAWRIAKEHLNNNEPLIASIDVYYLPYHHQYQQIHGAHSIILNGYDEEGNKVYIIDWYPPQFFKGVISTETLKQARNSLNPKDPLNPTYSGSSIQNRWLDIKYPSPHAELDESLTGKVILENIEVMRGNDREESHFQGIEGIRVFAEDILGWITQDDKDLFVAKIEKSFPFLQNVIAQRMLHLDFLSNIGKKLNKLELRRISEELTKIIQSWQVARSMFVKASKKEPKAMIPRISTRLLDIADREERALIRLKEIILAS